MQEIVNKQRFLHDKLYLSMENLLTYFSNIYNLNKDSRDNILDKIRLMNRDIKKLLHKSNKILIDIKNKHCIKDSKLIKELNLEDLENTELKKILPFMMLYHNIDKFNNTNLIG